MHARRTMTRLLAVLAPSAGCALAVSDGRALPHDYAEVVRLDAPVSYWRFGDRAGVAKDAVGSADAAYAAAVRLGAAGALAKDDDTAARFDGAGFAAGPDAYGFFGTSAFSVEVWIAPDAGGLPVQRVCNHRYGTPHTGWLLFVDATKNAVFERWTKDAVLGRVSAPLAVGRFSHVVVTYDGDALSLLVDGERRDSVADHGAIDPFSAPLVWGAASTMVLDFFSGALDEGAIYDRALTPSRVRAHFAAGARAEW